MRSECATLGFVPVMYVSTFTWTKVIQHVIEFKSYLHGIWNFGFFFPGLRNGRNSNGCGPCPLKYICIHFFAYDFGGEKSRPSDLQAWIAEGGILEERVATVEKFSITSIFRDKERIWERAQEIRIQTFASDFGVEEPDSAFVT